MPTVWQARAAAGVIVSNLSSLEYQLEIFTAMVSA